MKHFTYFALPVMVLLLLFLPPVMGFSPAAQAEGKITPESNNRIASDSDALTASASDASTNGGAAGATMIASYSNAIPVKITEIEINKNNINRIRLLKRGNSSASLSIQLDETINFYREGSAFAEKDIRFFIQLETEAFDRTYGDRTGLFFLKASIVLEDDHYSLAPEVCADIAIPIFLYDPDQPACLPSLDPDNNHYDDMETFNIVTAVHTDLQQVADMLMDRYPYKRFYLFFDNEYYLEVPNIWDVSSVKTDIPGVYTAYRRPKLPEGILIKNLPQAECSVNIQDPGVFTLSSPISFGNNLVATWLYPTPEKSLFRCWYRIGTGSWTLDKKEYFMCLVSGSDGKYVLYLNPWEMKKDIHYQFRLEYDGVYSKVLELCVNEDGFYIPNEGDRDGGDRNSQTPPDVTQQQPETAVRSDNTEWPGYTGTFAITEQDTKDASIWSGTRMQTYRTANPGWPLLFEKHRIRLELPADDPLFSSVTGQDSLYVDIEALSANTVRLGITWNGAPVSKIPLTVTIPWEDKEETSGLQVKDLDGMILCKAEYLEGKSAVVFQVNGPGTYTVEALSADIRPAGQTTVQTPGQTTARTSGQTTLQTASRTTVRAVPMAASLSPADRAVSGQTEPKISSPREPENLQDIGHGNLRTAAATMTAAFALAVSVLCLKRFRTRRED